MQNHYLVIMAGGVGSRFWPFSRESYPKQFHDVLGVGRTLLQQTVDRFEGVFKPENIFIVTSQGYKDLIKEQIPFLTDDQILEEPFRNNTAPCIAYASYKISKKDPNAIICISPSDHLILKEQEFQTYIKYVLKVAEKNNILITIGIEPSRPDTGYGYIQFDKKDTNILKNVLEFHEKPNLNMAQEFLKQGNFLWNAGIFIFSSNTILEAFQLHAPEIHSLFDNISPFYFTHEENVMIGIIYAECPEISFDYAIMEKVNNCGVIAANIGWSDLGTWKSVFEAAEKDINRNVIDGKVLTYNVSDSIIKTPNGRLVVVQGLKNYIVAEFENVLMICEKDQEQQVKQFVSDARKQGYEFI